MPAWVLPVVAGAGAALSSYGQSRANDRQADLSEAELAFLKQRYAEQEPLRAMGLSRLQSPLPERPDQGAAFADPSNPFYKPPQALGFGEGYTNQNPDLKTALPAYRETSRGAQQNQRRVDANSQLSPELMGVIEGKREMPKSWGLIPGADRLIDQHRNALGL